MDLIRLNGKPVLHIVDIETNYQNAIFISGKPIQDICHDFIYCWESVYTCFPNEIRLDQGSSFVSKEFRENVRGIWNKFIIQ